MENEISEGGGGFMDFVEGVGEAMFVFFVIAFITAPLWITVYCLYRIVTGQSLSWKWVGLWMASILFVLPLIGWVSWTAALIGGLVALGAAATALDDTQDEKEN